MTEKQPIEQLEVLLSKIKAGVDAGTIHKAEYKYLENAYNCLSDKKSHRLTRKEAKQSANFVVAIAESDQRYKINPPAQKLLLDTASLVNTIASR